MQVLIYDFDGNLIGTSEYNESTILPTNAYGYEILDEEGVLINSAYVGRIVNIENILNNQSELKEMMSETDYTNFKIYAQTENSLNGATDFVINLKYDDKPIYSYKAIANVLGYEAKAVIDSKTLREQFELDKSKLMEFNDMIKRI